ncbi:unnamed protein product [Rotaria sp. Silwood1]|nr:unnamed protein product [Rotaria sp. Silwood1]CAF4573163.1 unnamed protein product [Rotaria sp. Silwood1]CAF4709455.1 unnamed protein product [Rotaria sp. Silwood1]
MHNQNVVNEKTAEGSNLTSTMIGQQQQQLIHPLLMPSLNVSSQKISAMLAALTPSSTANTMPIHQSTSTSLATSNNNIMNSRAVNSTGNIRSNGSSFGWGNRERKMEENWRMQNRNI